jgi:hypothetical protein
MVRKRYSEHVPTNADTQPEATIMLTKTRTILAAVLLVSTASVASAQEFDPIPLNRYPAYNGAVTTSQNILRSAPVRLKRARHLRSAPARLHAGRDEFPLPGIKIAGLPRAFYDQQQPGYPQSPPGF